MAHGVRHAVVCPGSRNSAIVHNFNECPFIQCYPVTDERSAGFYAMGMAQALKQPVVVCVTSGTALLNLAPAMAEAFYQHIPLVAISADRPQQWIDQLDGQTLPQSDALGRFVKKAVSLLEPHDAEEKWYCNRLVNEALLAAMRGGPVHINVPITEPLFEYSVDELPAERKIAYAAADMSPATLSHVTRMFLSATRPMLISGQPMNPLLDEAVSIVGDDEEYVPDFVLYIGGSIVSKRLKRFLRKAKETWVVNNTGEIADTFMNLTHVFQGDGEAVADHIRFMMVMEPHPFIQKWDDLLARIRLQAESYEPAYSELAAVKYFEHYVGDAEVHYANSSAIRLANSFAQHPVWCNRGVNGIEGSLSTAAGFSCVTDKRVYCVIGDLSFFYDQNALWNQNLRGNLRILLMNNGKGVIFNMLPGLEQSPARDKYVAAEHHANAEGICQQNAVTYRQAKDMQQMQEGIDWLTATESERPLLLEVFL
jgi:2-succinyl-5-enolpyruvyl-6-hydroxy-3-cyclohexene-1-carboxylate synthase